MIRKLFALLVIVTSLVASGCQTIQGLGKDIQSGGEALEKATK